MITNCTHCGKAISTKQERCLYCQTCNELHSSHKVQKKSPTLGLMLRTALGFGR